MSEGADYQEALAHVQGVEPLWSEPLFEAIGDLLPRPSGAQLLMAEARCGYIPTRLVETLPDDSRIIALDPSRAMLDQARQRIDDSMSRRLYFVPQRLGAISYADDVFQAAVCVHGIVTPRHAEDGMRELARVTRPGGHIVVSAPLSESFALVFDMLDEALRSLRHDDVHTRMNQVRQNLLDINALAHTAKRAGLHHAELTELSWQLSFKSGRHLMISPLVRETFFPHWIGAVPGDERDSAMRYIADAIDTYYHGRDLVVDFCVGVVHGTR